MKYRIQFIVACLALVVSACKKPSPTEGQVWQATHDISMAASFVGYYEYILKGNTSPGEIALQVEKIRELKVKLIEVRNKWKDVIPMEASERMAEESRRSGFEEMEDKQRALEIREESIDRGRRGGNGIDG